MVIAKRQADCITCDEYVHPQCFPQMSHSIPIIDKRCRSFSTFVFPRMYATRHESRCTNALIGERCRECSRLIPDLSYSNSVSMMNLLRNMSLSRSGIRWLRMFRRMPVTSFRPRHQGDEAATGRQLAEAAPTLLPDPVDPEVLEIPERGEMEQRHDEQHPGQGQLAAPQPGAAGGDQPLALPILEHAGKSSGQQNRDVMDSEMRGGLGVWVDGSRHL